MQGELTHALQHREENMSLLNLADMAKYGAYGNFFSAMNSWMQRENNNGSTYIHPVKFIGSTASIDMPIAPVEPIEAQRLNAVINSKSIDAQFEKVNFYFHPINENYYKTNLQFLSRPSVFDVNMNEDPSNPVTAKTDKGDGATFSKETRIAGTLDFTFQPGAMQKLNYNLTTGVDVSTAVTEGVSNTTSSGGSSTTTISAELGGSFLGFNIGGSLSREWTSEWGQSQTIDYSKSNTQTISKSESNQVSVDLGQIAPTNGKYVYNNTELIPGQRYQIIVSETKETVRAPVSGLLNLTGENLILAAKAKMPSNYDDEGDYTFGVTRNVANSILDAYLFNYDALYRGDLSKRIWDLQENPLMLQTDVAAEGRFSGASGFSIDVKPVVKNLVKANAQTLDLTLDAALASSETSTRYINLDDYNIEGDDVVGVAINLADFGEPMSTRFSIVGTTGGGDQVTLDGHPTTLWGFRHSIFMVESGENFFFNAADESNNTFFLDGGYNTVYITSNDHYVASRDGHNLIIVGWGEGLNVDNGLGADILKIETTVNDIVVNNWDFNQDVLQFGGKVNLSDVRVVYDPSMTEYQVFIQDDLVAVLDADDSNLPVFNPETRTYSGTAVVPFALKSVDSTPFLGSLYSAALDRAPDAAGLEYWQSVLEAGASRKGVVEAFFSSSEYNNLNESNESFVAGLYRDLLGRAPDVAGEAYWLNALESGVARASVVTDFVNSSEFNAFFN